MNEANTTGLGFCVNTKFNLLIQMAKFSAGRCFSVLPGYHHHLAGYSHVISRADPDDKKAETLPKRGKAGSK